MADSVGKGIALGERFKYDTTSGTKLLNDAIQYKVASDKKKKADLVSSLDFKIDYSKVLPVYGKEMAKRQAEVLNNYSRYMAEDKNTARNRIQEDFYKAQQDIGRLARDNEAAKSYLSQKAGFAINPALANAFTSTDSDFDTISKFNDGYFTSIGKRGEFAFRPVEEMNPSSQVKFDPQDYDMRLGKSKPVGIPGKTQIEEIEFVKPAAIARNAVSLTTNPQFRDNVLLARPDLLALPEKDQYTAIYDEAFKISSQLARAPKSEWKIVDLPNPSGSGSDKDKREKPVIVTDTQQTLLISTGNMKEVKEGSKTITEPERVQKNSTIPLSTAIPNVPAVTIPLDKRVINANTNRYVEGEELNQTVTFKPDMVYSESIKNTNKWEKYVMGTATINVEKQGDVVTQKVITYKMPYDKLKSAIEGKYDMTDFDEKFSALSGGSAKPATKQIKSSDISSRAKAAGYTDQEYRKLLTEKGVKIID